MRTLWHVWFGWLIVAVWMAVIFYASTDRFSAAHTSRFIVPFLTWLFHRHLSESEVETVHFLIRKGAHLTEYAILALVTWNAIQQTTAAKYPSRQPNYWTVSGWAFLTATVYAASDEFHQSFVPSRGASVHDVMLDSVGALIGLLCLRGCLQLRRRWSPDPPSPGRF